MLDTTIWNLENSYIKNGTLYAIDKGRYKPDIQQYFLKTVETLDLSSISRIENFVFYQCDILFDKIIIGKDTLIDYFSFYGIRSYPIEIILNENSLYRYDNDLKRFYLLEDERIFFPIILMENINNMEWEDNNICWYSVGREIGKFTAVDAEVFEERYNSITLYPPISLKELDISLNFKFSERAITFFKNEYDCIEVDLNDILNMEEVLSPIFNNLSSLSYEIKNKEYSFKDLFFSVFFEYFSCNYLDGYMLCLLLKFEELSREKEKYKKRECSIAISVMCQEILYCVCKHIYTSKNKNYGVYLNSIDDFTDEDRKNIFSNYIFLQKTDYEYLLSLKNKGYFMLSDEFIDFWVNEIKRVYCSFQNK